MKKKKHEKKKGNSAAQFDPTSFYSNTVYHRLVPQLSPIENRRFKDNTVIVSLFPPRDSTNMGIVHISLSSLFRFQLTRCFN